MDDCKISGVTATVLTDNLKAQIRDYLNILEVPFTTHQSGLSVANTLATNPHRGCLIVDLVDPFEGIAAQKELIRRGVWVPVVYILESAEQAMDRSVGIGIVERVYRPISFVSFQRTMERITFKVETCDEVSKASTYASRVTELSMTEKFVARLASDGIPNKRIARRLDRSEKSIEKIRQRVYKKLDVHSAAELARAVTASNIVPLLELARQSALDLNHSPVHAGTIS